MLFSFSLCICALGAPTREPPQEQVAEPSKTAVDTPESKTREFYRSKAYGVRGEANPPSYVASLSELGERIGQESWQSLDWLDFGLEHRVRWDLRDDDYTAQTVENRDTQFLMRTRIYTGIRRIADPFRFVLEVQDARQFGSRYPDDTSDVNELDVLQLYGELYLEDALADEPIRLLMGRMTLDLVDRRLVGRNRWRNTINAFDGVRICWGESGSDWQVDLFAVMPVERRLRQHDRWDEQRWLAGGVGSWRGGSPWLTLEPYYFILDVDRDDSSEPDRNIHTLGLRAYGQLGGSGFDYDVDTAFQFGKGGSTTHRAMAAFGEIGYAWAHDWKPRLSVAAAYASGDRNPNDHTSERFERLFGVSHCWSMSDFLTLQNSVSTKIRLELSPVKKLKLDGAYGAYWLASDRDAWVAARRSNVRGHHNNFIGQELEVRARYQLRENLELELGYAHFMPGDFIETSGPADDSDFFYTAVSVHF